MDFIVQFAQPLRGIRCSCTERIYTYDYRSSDLILGDFKRDWVKDDDSSAQLPSVSDSSRSTTAPLSIIDRQQYPSGFYQPMVPVEHTAIVILTAHILYGVSLLQD